LPQAKAARVIMENDLKTESSFNQFAGKRHPPATFGKKVFDREIFELLHSSVSLR
jgi:hypothetical protein